MSTIHFIFGQGKDLNVLNMACRAVVMFFVTLLFIRIAGMRSFAKKSAFDDIIVIMLGAILSRPVVGASAFLPTLTGGLVLVLIHKILARISLHSKVISSLIKGQSRCLYNNGQYNKENMRKSSLSEDDILEELRVSLHQNNLENVEEIHVERGGKVSIIKKRE